MGRNDHGRQPSGPFVGVYISASHVKLLELTGKPNNIRVASYAAQGLPANAVAEHQIVNVDAVGQAIASALEKSGTRNKNAAVGVSGSAVISKTITMSSEMSDEDIEQQIMFEAPQHIPYPIENVSLDFQLLGPDPENTTRNQILLVACRRDNVEMRTAVLEIAKLTPRLVDVDEFALGNACSLLYDQMPNKGHGNTVAIFDIGTQQTRLNVQDDRRAVYSQEIAFGGQSLAQGIVGQNGLDHAEQLSAQLRDGRLKGLDIADALNDFCDQAAQQIENTLEFYFATEAETDTIDKVLLTGSATLYPGFEQRMQDSLPWPVACADPLRGMNYSRSSVRNHIEHDGPSLMTAAGLSMRSIM